MANGFKIDIVRYGQVNEKFHNAIIEAVDDSFITAHVLNFQADTFEARLLPAGRYSCASFADNGLCRQLDFRHFSDENLA
jgi:DNA-binding GntR family transcriptional regulator